MMEIGTPTSTISSRRLPEHARIGGLHPFTKAATAGRIGLRQGKISESTSFVKLKPGATRLRALLDVLGNNFQGADAVGTLHDMRFVFLDNDTKLLFAAAYDGDWDAYIDDFATKIPDALDVLFCDAEGWRRREGSNALAKLSTNYSIRSDSLNANNRVRFGFR
jgi:hypothetical protein